MSILTKHLEFVNEQITFHENYVAKVGGVESFRGRLHNNTADKFKALAADLEAASKVLDAPPLEKNQSPVIPPQRSPIQLSLAIEDIEGLPQELIEELNLTEGDRTEFAILNAIDEAGGIISLDRLLIAIYRKTGEIHKRANLTSRLARMSNKNTIYYVPGKKGVYSTEQLTAEDAAKMFGAAKQETS